MHAYHYDFLLSLAKSHCNYKEIEFFLIIILLTKLEFRNIYLCGQQNQESTRESVTSNKNINCLNY